MPRSTWVFASLLSALVLGALGYLQWRETDRSARSAREEADRLQADARGAQQTNQWFAAQLAAARDEIDALQRQINERGRESDDLERRMRAELQSRDVTISELQGALTVDIVDRVLFDSGAAELKPEGREILQRVAEVLARFPDRQIQVIGHTDNVPIRGRTPAGFTDNWSLSAGRALAAVRFLHEEAGVHPQRVAAVACGEFRPIADNATPAGRARNRRIAVVVLPERWIASDAPGKDPEVPTPSPEASPETHPESTQPGAAPTGTAPDGIPADTTKPVTPSDTDAEPLPEIPVPTLPVPEFHPTVPVPGIPVPTPVPVPIPDPPSDGTGPKAPGAGSDA